MLIWIATHFMSHCVCMQRIGVLPPMSHRSHISLLLWFSTYDCDRRWCWLCTSRKQWYTQEQTRACADPSPLLFTLWKHVCEPSLVKIYSYIVICCLFFLKTRITRFLLRREEVGILYSSYATAQILVLFGINILVWKLCHVSVMNYKISQPHHVDEW
jgi:hypothetical protein